MTIREGSLEAPTRHPIDWKSPEYLDEPKIVAEMERIFDICHGCRRCVSLCNTFPKLFDYVDESDSGEGEGVAKEKYWDLVDQCHLCDVHSNEPAIAQVVVRTLGHSENPFTIAHGESCCGMHTSEQGDLETVEKLKSNNTPTLAKLARDGYAILTPVPSCTLMFKQEL